MSDYSSLKIHPFLRLPVELQIQILECLKIPSQISCMLVSHHFYDLFRHIRDETTFNNPIKDRIWRRLIPMLWWQGGTGLLTNDPLSTWVNGRSGQQSSITKNHGSMNEQVIALVL